MHLCFDVAVNTVGEIFATLDFTTQVVTAIDVVANPGESKDVVTIGIHTTTTDVGLGMS